MYNVYNSDNVTRYALKKSHSRKIASAAPPSQNLFKYPLLPVESVSLRAIWHKDFCKSLVFFKFCVCQRRHVTSYTQPTFFVHLSPWLWWPNSGGFLVAKRNLDVADFFHIVQEGWPGKAFLGKVTVTTPIKKWRYKMIRKKWNSQKKNNSYYLPSPTPAGILLGQRSFVYLWQLL